VASERSLPLHPRSPRAHCVEPWLDGRLTETDAHGRAFEIGRVTQWTPGEKLAFTWRQASFAQDQ
jgi:hypothetical protein